MKKSMLALLFAMGAMGTGTLAACDANDGPVEEAGEDIDEAAEDAGDEMEEAADEVEEEVDR